MENQSKEGGNYSKPATRLTSGKGIYLEVHNITEGPVDDERAETVDEPNANKSGKSSDRLSPVSKQLYGLADSARNSIISRKLNKKDKALS